MDRREKIVRVALSLLREEGAKGLSQPQVARRARIPQGHLTYYFPRKADLVAAVARLLQQEVLTELQGLAGRFLFGDARRASAEFLLAVITNTERTRAVLGLAIEAERDSQVRAVLNEIVDSGRPGIGAVLGVDPADPTVDVVQACVWGLQLRQLFRRSDRAEVGALVERLLDWLVQKPEKARNARAKKGAKR